MDKKSFIKTSGLTLAQLEVLRMAARKFKSTRGEQSTELWNGRWILMEFAKTH